MQTLMPPCLASVVPLILLSVWADIQAFPSLLSRVELCPILALSGIEIRAWGGRRLQEGAEMLEDEKRGEKGAREEEGGWGGEEGRGREEEN